jgi:cullin 3
VKALHNKFLQTLETAWTDYQASMEIIKNIFHHLDGMYITENDVYNIHDLGLIIFRDQVNEILIPFRYRQNLSVVISVC